MKFIGRKFPIYYFKLKSVYNGEKIWIQLNIPIGDLFLSLSL
jgi:hypothetical protein